MDQRVRHLKMQSVVILKEFKDIKLAKSIDYESYYILEGDSRGYSWAGNWTYIEANGEYEQKIIERIINTQRVKKSIEELDLTEDGFFRIVPYINELVDIIIPQLKVVISNITKYKCRVEYTGLETEDFENKLIYIDELEDILKRLAKRNCKIDK